MTTIIIIVVVALVFFVTICVVTFMVWKRENELRTDSIQAIEQNLEKLNEQLTGDVALPQPSQPAQSTTGSRVAASRKKDPFSWVKETPAKTASQPPPEDPRQAPQEMLQELQDMLQQMQKGPGGITDNNGNDQSNQQKETEFVDTATEEEINLDLAQLFAEGPENQGTPQQQEPERQAFAPVLRTAAEPNVGKSGREYTASELDALIKE